MGRPVKAMPELEPVAVMTSRAIPRTETLVRIADVHRSGEVAGHHREDAAEVSST
jgi:hypothetical protein